MWLHSSYHCQLTTTDELTQCVQHGLYLVVERMAWLLPEYWIEKNKKIIIMLTEYAYLSRESRNDCYNYYDSGFMY